MIGWASCDCILSYIYCYKDSWLKNGKSSNLPNLETSNFSTTQIKQTEIGGRGNPVHLMH